jgi:hypothetical protein
MKVRDLRLRARKRWRPSLVDIMGRVFRKHADSFIDNLESNNALYRSLRGRA